MSDKSDNSHDVILGLQKQALKSIFKQDYEYLLRKICRWYSNKFYTPLHIVENDLPTYYILQHFYESKYEDMNRNDLIDEKDKILTKNKDKRLNDIIESLQEETQKMEDDMFAAKIKQDQGKLDLKDIKIEKSKPMSGVEEIEQAFKSMENVNLKFSDELDKEVEKDMSLFNDISKK